MSSSTWTQNNDKSLIKSIIKNERTDDDERSNLSSSTNTTSSSPHIQSSSNNQIESIYSDSTTLKNLQHEQYSSTNGRINKKIIFQLNCFSFKLESSAFTGQFIRADLQSYTDPIVYYGDGLIDPHQQTYSHLPQGKIHHSI
jgi:membrane-bound lytic murein transglycosylase